MRTPHSSTNKGKRVKITMRNGTILIGKFKDKKSGAIILDGFDIKRSKIGNKEMEVYRLLEKTRRINMSDVRAFSIFKPL